MKKEILIWEKSNLTIEEAAAYFNIGTNKLRKLASKEDCNYVLWVGSKCLIKKACFEDYLRKQYSVFSLYCSYGVCFSLLLFQKNCIL